MWVIHCLWLKKKKSFRWLGRERKRMLRTTLMGIYFFSFFLLWERAFSFYLPSCFDPSSLFRVEMRGQRWRPSGRMSFRFLFLAACLRLAVLIFPRCDFMHLSFALTVVLSSLFHEPYFFFTLLVTFRRISFFFEIHTTKQQLWLILPYMLRS